MNAEQARTAQQIEQSRAADLSEIKDKIKKHISGGQGEPFVWVYSLSKSQKEALEREGYKVTSQSDGRNGTDYKISW